jgi:hypothetical protein
MYILCLYKRQENFMLGEKSKALMPERRRPVQLGKNSIPRASSASGEGHDGCAVRAVRPGSSGPGR